MTLMKLICLKRLMLSIQVGRTKYLRCHLMLKTMEKSLLKKVISNYTMRFFFLTVPLLIAGITATDSAQLKGAMYIFLCFFLLIFQVEYLTFAATHKLLELFRVVFMDFNFPKSLPTIKKEVSFNSLTDDITTYATCPTCYSLYLYSTSAGLSIPSPPKYCTYIDPLEKKECHTSVFQNGSNIPIKRTVYHCLVSSIQKLFLRKGFEEKCNEWRFFSEVTSSDDMMYHCSQGKMWRSIKSFDGSPFVGDERSLCLTLNAGNILK